jgi:hypothetical protein
LTILALPAFRVLRRTLWSVACLTMALAGGAAGAGKLDESAWKLHPRQATAGAAFTLTLAALHEARGWQSLALPVLTITCAPAKAVLYVEMGLPLEVTPVDQQIVRVRFDDAASEPQRWREVNNTAVSPRDAAAVIGRLVASRRFVLEVNAFGAPPARAEFAPAGLGEYLPLLEGTCLRKPK